MSNHVVKVYLKFVADKLKFVIVAVTIAVIRPLAIDVMHSVAIVVFLYSVQRGLGPLDRGLFLIFLLDGIQLQNI